MRNADYLKQNLTLEEQAELMHCDVKTLEYAYREEERYRAYMDESNTPSATPVVGTLTMQDLEIASSLWVEASRGKMVLKDEDFVLWYRDMFHITCLNGRLYKDGVYIPNSKIAAEFTQIFELFVTVGARKVTELIQFLAMKSFVELTPPDPDCIYFQNCTLRITKEGIGRMDSRSDCLCRVPHDYSGAQQPPVAFLELLQGLFYGEDIRTIQQYLGYCLMPNTYAQKALFIIGNGGEGKSRLTYLMQNVLGGACMNSKINRVNDRFFGTAMEQKLLFIDDDLRCDKFSDTENFKTIVTAETPITVEPKGGAYYETTPFIRFLLLGNQSLGSLHDHSDGFYRRIHIVRTRPKPKGRIDDPTLIRTIWETEQAQILHWLVQGAYSIVTNGYRLHQSLQSQNELTELKLDDNTALAFLMEQKFIYGERYSLGTMELYNRYGVWCFQNHLHQVVQKTFMVACKQFFAQQEEGISHKRVNGASGRIMSFCGIDFA